MTAVSAESHAISLVCERQGRICGIIVRYSLWLPSRFGSRVNPVAEIPFPRTPKKNSGKM